MYVVFQHHLNPSRTSQHMLAHGNPAATQNSFSKVIGSSAASTSNKRLLSLRSQCLLPGEYHRHISKWLEYFPPKQVRALIGTKPYTYMILISMLLAVHKSVLSHTKHMHL